MHKIFFDSNGHEFKAFIRLMGEQPSHQHASGYCFSGFTKASLKWYMYDTDTRFLSDTLGLFSAYTDFLRH